MASDTGHYPVRKRGQKRTLNPNRDAIRWLENETLDDTEISQVYPLGAGLECVRAQGFVKARVWGCPRRMFDVFALEASSTMPVSRTACEACDNFSRTWACTEHPSSGQEEHLATLRFQVLRPLDGRYASILQAAADGFTLEITDETDGTPVRTGAGHDDNA